MDATGVQDLFFEAELTMDALLKAINDGETQPNEMLLDSGFALTSGNYTGNEMTCGAASCWPKVSWISNFDRHLDDRAGLFTAGPPSELSKRYDHGHDERTSERQSSWRLWVPGRPARLESPRQLLTASPVF